MKEQWFVFSFFKFSFCECIDSDTIKRFCFLLLLPLWTCVTVHLAVSPIRSFSSRCIFYFSSTNILYFGKCSSWSFSSSLCCYCFLFFIISCSFFLSHHALARFVYIYIYILEYSPSRSSLLSRFPVAELLKTRREELCIFIFVCLCMCVLRTDITEWTRETFRKKRKLHSLLPMSVSEFSSVLPVEGVRWTWVWESKWGNWGVSVDDVRAWLVVIVLDVSCGRVIALIGG